MALCTVERGIRSKRRRRLQQLIRKTSKKKIIQKQNKIRKSNHKKIQYTHKVQPKMKPDQRYKHTHTHTHTEQKQHIKAGHNQKPNKRHNREERSRQKHLTSVKIIWRRLQQKKETKHKIK